MIGIAVLLLVIGVYYDNLWISLGALINSIIMPFFKGHLMNKRVLKREYETQSQKLREVADN